uniref:Lon proteolytic domain-containing protein n=1 Tax=Globodera rostochiensis TaxID=31243 RepID=A0A914IB03_GLORO
MPIHALDIMGYNKHCSTPLSMSQARGSMRGTAAGIKAMVMPRDNMREFQRLETQDKGEVRLIYISRCSQLWAEMLEEE